MTLLMLIIGFGKCEICSNLLQPEVLLTWRRPGWMMTLVSGVGPGVGGYSLLLSYLPFFSLYLCLALLYVFFIFANVLISALFPTRLQ